MSKSIVDRILSGEFDDEELDEVQLSGSPTPSTSNSVNYAEEEDGDPGDEDDYDDEDQTVTEEEDMEEEELEELLEEVEEVEEVWDERLSWLLNRVLKDRIEELEDKDDTDYSNYVSKPESLPLTRKQKVSKPKKEPKTMTNKSKPATTATLSPPTKPSLAAKTTEGRGRPHKLAAHFKELVRLYAEGLSTKAIAEQYKVSVACVITSLKLNGATIRPKGRRSRKGA